MPADAAADGRVVDAEVVRDLPHRVPVLGVGGGDAGVRPRLKELVQRAADGLLVGLGSGLDLCTAAAKAVLEVRHQAA